MLASYPLLSAAAQEATQRNLAASTQFLKTKESMPSAYQNQLYTQALAKAQELGSISQAYQAAKSGGFSGRHFSYIG
jgi:hypothetical protein